MGLFDKFLGGKSSETVRLDAREAFAAMVIAIVGADGNVSDDEVRAANAVFNRMRLFAPQSAEEFRMMFDRLLGYLQKHGGDWLLAKSVEGMTDDLRETAFATAVDLVFADGSVESGEKALIEKLQRDLRISDELALKIIEVISIKNRG
jgi:uncharacterized tellurite resistance protein B-like protein